MTTRYFLGFRSSDVRDKEGSALSRVGLQSGDVVMSINGQPVTSSDDIAKIFLLRAQRQPVTAYVLRDGQTLFMQIDPPPRLTDPTAIRPAALRHAEAERVLSEAGLVDRAPGAP